MDRRNLIVASAAALAASSAANASGSSNGNGNGDDWQGENVSPLVGSWVNTITAVNPPLGQFISLASFQVGGVVVESRRYLVPTTPFGPLLETSGHGAWKRTGRRTYAAFFRFLMQSSTSGAPFGTDNIRLALRLDPQTDLLTGTFESQIKDLNDQVIFMATGTVAGTRITV